MWYKKIAGSFFGLVIKHTCDRRTDGRTELRLPRQDRAGIAASRGKTISSTRPSCRIQISTVDVINIAANRQKFMTLTVELS